MHHGGGGSVTVSVSVLTDPTTFGMLNSDLTSCPRTAPVLGGLAAQWQRMMVTLQRVGQEAVSSQNLDNAIENMGKTRIDATGSRLRLKDGRGFYPKSWSGTTPLGGFAREVATWLGFVGPIYEGEKWIQQITKETLFEIR